MSESLEQWEAMRNGPAPAPGAIEITITNDMERDFEAHRAGCRDVGRRDAAGWLNGFWTITVPAGASVADAVHADVNEDHDEGDEWPVRVMPCCIPNGSRYMPRCVNPGQADKELFTPVAVARFLADRG